MNDDELDLDDDDDLGEGEGQAAVLHWVDSLGVRLAFAPTLDAAQRLAAQPCTVPGCLGGHTIAYGDGTGRVRVIADADTGEVMDRFNDLLRVREVRRRLRARVNEAARQQRRRAAKRAVLQRGDTDGAD